MFSFMAHTNVATSPKRLETELTNITRRHLCSLPVFFSLYLLSLISFFFVICLFWQIILWQLSTTHVRDNTRDRDANSSSQNNVTWYDFLQWKQVELSLAFAAENIKNLPLALRAREKIWARLVRKSNSYPVAIWGETEDWGKVKARGNSWQGTRKK